MSHRFGFCVVMFQDFPVGMFDGLWIPTSWKFSREMFLLLFFFVVFGFKRDVWDVWDVYLNFASIFSQVFYCLQFFGPCHGPFTSLDFHRVPHCQGIPQCRDHHSEVMCPVRMIRKHAYMSNTKKKWLFRVCRGWNPAQLFYKAWNKDPY